MTKSALVTGGSGYFGELLVKKLINKDYQVSIFDIVKNSDLSSDINFLQGDIRELDLVERACEDIDIVFHCVAQVPVAKSKHLFETVNINGTHNLLTAALKKNVKKVIYVSSSAVFGVPQKNPVIDTTPTLPAEAYGKAKLAGEEICQTFIKKGLDVSIIRPRTILGHGRLGIFQILFEWIYQGKNIPVLGSGDNIYQFIHADDLAQACILAGEKSGSDIFNCGTEKFGTMRESLEELCLYAKTGSKVKSFPKKIAQLGMNFTSTLGLSPLGPYHSLMYGESMYFDTTDLSSKLGWSSNYSNKEMFIDSYQWYVNNRDHILKQKGASAHKSSLKQGALKFVSWFI